MAANRVQRTACLVAFVRGPQLVPKRYRLLDYKIYREMLICDAKLIEQCNQMIQDPITVNSGGGSNCIMHRKDELRSCLPLCDLLEFFLEALPKRLIGRDVICH